MKFREFETSSGKKVLAGKSAANNEELVEQIKPDEDVFHTAKPGSPFCNIKSSRTNTNDRRETAIFCASKSQDWRDNKSDVEVHHFKGKDISKKRGMKLGTFAVKKHNSIFVKKKKIQNLINKQKK